jgi:dTDP-4-amino-4,6-dideoxygalactose transaminase
MHQIPFNKPYFTGRELWYVSQAMNHGYTCGDGAFTKKCQSLLERQTKTHKALLTHSCTAALEMAALIACVQPGDEVIMPSYTFVSTANAFALRGAVPVFVDIRPDTLNIDEALVEEAITPKTKAICVVHYAGVPCEMDVIMDIANRHGLIVIEDAAQAMCSEYKGRALGTIGHLGCFSFHETKNIQCGEGGALLINDERYVERAEIIREKGTNRAKFFRGEVDKYSWVDIGSSFLPSEVTAAFLLAQLEAAESITNQRRWIWRMYDEAFRTFVSKSGELLRTPNYCGNGHMYYLILDSKATRNAFINYMKYYGIQAVSHYVALHSSPKGSEVSRVESLMARTNVASEQLVRLPLWLGLEVDQRRIIECVHDFFGRQG